MKRQKLSEYLDRIKSALDQQDYNNAKRIGETALKKLRTLSYSSLDKYQLYVNLGGVYYHLAEYSRSLDIFYRAYLVSVRFSLSETRIIYASFGMGHNLLMMRNLDLALAQFQKVEQYYKKYGDKIFPMDAQRDAWTLLMIGHCYLGKNELEKVSDVIENRLSSREIILLSKEALADYNQLRGGYLIAINEYKQARESLRECIKLGEQFNLPTRILDAKSYLAVINLLENKIDDAIKTLLENLRDARRLKFNNFICESGLLLSKCYLLKGLPDKSASIEERIKPILAKLDTVWLYEKIREFEKLYRQLKLPRQSQPIPAILVNALSRRHETSPYKWSIIGNSAAMQEVFQLIEKIAPTDLPILIQGETGTGKELIAQAIHANSPRSAKTFLAFNCGAIPESLLESALFGHTKGAFTGAEEDKKGYIELASGGTLFIDEISSMSGGMQQKLLRVLEENLVWRICAQKQIAVNTRFIFASNQDIKQMVKQKLFREDLFYRINTIIVNLPTLRERKEDVPLLIEHFLKKYHPSPQSIKSPHPPFAKGEKGGLEIRGDFIPEVSQDALRLLTAYSWPGNIRELENEIKRICVLHPNTNLIIKPMLSDIIRNYSADETQLPARPSGGAGATLKELTCAFQRNMIIQTIKKCNGRITHAARLLGFTRPHLHEKMRQLNIPSGKSNKNLSV
ncbi:MAG: sigma-54-dependent Fis family transcriptional regulator [Planctomycetes bacterium]|nr:sigma-54-dependent Fis family transcriptional regulator [Planctomycetota bacterium]